MSWDDDLLRPDHENYRFDAYFQFDYTNGAMTPSSLATEQAINQAKATIKAYGLDIQERRRKPELRKWQKSSDRDIDEWAIETICKMTLAITLSAKSSHVSGESTARRTPTDHGIHHRLSAAQVGAEFAGAVCMLIPIVGPLVLVGWMVGPMFRSRDPVDFERFPDFDFSNFGKLLERGVWPFLVNLVAGIVMVPVMWLLLALPIGLLVAGTAVTDPEKNSEALGLLAFCSIGLVVLLIAAAGCVVTLVIRPLMLRAAITQDFGQAFNFRFVKDFVARTWVEQLLSILFLVVAGITLMIIGMFAICLGAYLVIPLITFAQWHLERQIDTSRAVVSL